LTPAIAAFTPTATSPAAAVRTRAELRRVRRLNRCQAQLFDDHQTIALVDEI
jgi:hypothetical protein